MNVDSTTDLGGVVIEQKMKILELTGCGAGGDFLVNLRPKTLNKLGSSCEKKSGYRR